MKKYGIDVAKYQGDFNFRRAFFEGVKFAVIKGGGGDDGLYIDPKFKQNYQNAKAARLPVGIYWFSKALTVSDAVKEADYFYENCLKGRQFELPVYIDVEHKSQLDLGKRLLTDIIKAWCERVRSRGFYVGIYSSLAFFNNLMYDNELQNYTHWVACWGVSCDYRYKDVFGMWQFGAGIVAGVNCDQDYMLMDLISEVKNNGNSEGAKPPSPDTVKVNNLYLSLGTAALRTAPNLSGEIKGRCVREGYYPADELTVPSGGSQKWFKHWSENLYSALTDTDGSQLFRFVGNCQKREARENVNFREEPTLGGRKIKLLPKGTVIYLTGKRRKSEGITWAECVYNEKIGWCDEQWIG